MYTYVIFYTDIGDLVIKVLIFSYIFNYIETGSIKMWFNVVLVDQSIGLFATIIRILYIQYNSGRTDFQRFE